MPDLKLLILGANSFLAVNLAITLSKAGNRAMIGLIHESSNRLDYSLYKKIYTDPFALFREEKDFDVIYLIGAFIPTGDAEHPDKRYIKDNIELVAKVSTHYPGARIVFVSSVSVYGKPLQLPLTEQSPFNVPSLYGLSKIGGEAIIKNHGSYAIIRFSSIWGSGMSLNTFIPRTIQQARNGSIQLWGDGSRLQNYIHVKDAALFCMYAGIANENLVLLGVYPESYSNKDIAGVISAKLEVPINFKGKDMADHFVYDAGITYRSIGFIPSMGIKENIGELL